MKIILVILTTSFCLSSQVSAYQQINKIFPEVPEFKEREINKSQIKGWHDFRKENPKWRINWREESQGLSILGPPTGFNNGTPQHIAESFLKNNNGLLGLPENLEGLELQKVDKRRAYHLTFQQNHNEIPVEGGLINVNMTSDGMIYYVEGNYYENLSLSNSIPTISSADAVNYALNDLGKSIEQMSKSNAELVVLPYGAEFKLAWKTSIHEKNSIGNWIYYVSSENGDILTGYNDYDIFSSSSSSLPTANGDVYDHHPNAGSIVNRTLTHLSGAGNELDGSYVKVFNDDTTEISNGDFTHSPTHTHFDEVMVYYHATEFQKYMGNEVGYSYLNYPNSLVKVHANVHYGTDYNGAGAGYGDSLVFGDGDGTLYNSLAKEDVVIAHEY